MLSLIKKASRITLIFQLGSVTCCFAASELIKDTSTIESQVSIMLNHHNDQTPWLSGGLGRFQFGDQETETTLAGELDLGLRHEFTEQFSGHLYTQIQAQHEHNSQDHLNVIEWFFRYKLDLSFEHELTFKLGQYFFPSSFENINTFWETPYSLTFSSLNSWIGEEFRPIGLDLQYRYYGLSRKRLTLGTSLFGGNDSMGALLAWRGWSYGRVKTGLGDVLALPSLASLDTGGTFDLQRDDGTRPFGRDLDGRAGFAIRSLFESDPFTFNLAWVDNLGDKRLHQGEYAWRTRFFMAGASFQLSDSLELLTEAIGGNTRMGKNNSVDVDFYSTYLMLSYIYNDIRFSLRHDRFSSDDLDDIDEENNDQGRSYTLAIMRETTEKYRAGIELLFLESERDRTLSSSEEIDNHIVQFGFIFQYRL